MRTTSPGRTAQPLNATRRAAAPATAAGVALAVALHLALPASARGAELEGGLDAELGAGIDTNPERVLGSGGAADGFASALVRGRLKVSGERFRLTAQLAEAGRLYRAAGDATAGASRLDAAGALRLTDHLSAGAALLASDLTERGHRLDQDAIDGTASLTWSTGRWAAAASAGWNVFSPRDGPLRPFLATGPHASLLAWWEFLVGETVSASYELAAPSYPRWRDVAGTGRDDRTHTVSAEYVHRGAFVAAVGYAYAWNRSSAAGGDFDRHRVTGRAAADLPLELTLAVRGSLQWSSYPQPLFLAEQLLLAEGQQNLDALEARLTRPLTGPLELGLALALYRAEAVAGPGDVPSFTRGVAALFLAWRGQWRSTTGTPYGPDGR